MRRGPHCAWRRDRGSGVPRRGTARGIGGWGDPLLRDPELVLNDVKRGLVSRDKAKADYGVILQDDHTINAEETTTARSLMSSERGQPSAFDFGNRNEVA